MNETYSTPPVYTPAELIQLLGPEGLAACPVLLAPLHMLVPLIKQDIGPIGKSGKMKPGKDGTGPSYDFRTIEDILNEAHAVLVRYGVRWRKSKIISHKLTSSGKAETCVMEVEYIFTGPLGDTETTVAVGEATDFGSDKATNKADTAARKNMLVDWLALATEDPDSERPDRIDERPQVQPAGIERFTEVFDSIGALSAESKPMVAAYAEAQGISLKKREWEAMTQADYTKMKAFIAARAKVDAAAAGATLPGYGTPAAMDAMTDKAPSGYEDEAPAAAEREAPISDVQWAQLDKAKADLKPEQRQTIGKWAQAQGIGYTPAKPPSQADFLRLLQETVNLSRGSGNAGVQPKTLSATSRAARETIVAAVEELDVDSAVGFEKFLADSSEGVLFGPWREMVMDAPDGWDERLAEILDGYLDYISPGEDPGY